MNLQQVKAKFKEFVHRKWPAKLASDTIKSASTHYEVNRAMLYMVMSPKSKVGPNKRMLEDMGLKREVGYVPIDKKESDS